MNKRPLSISNLTQLLLHNSKANSCANVQSRQNNQDLSPCYIWFRTPPAYGWAIGRQTPCWVGPGRTPSPWGCRVVYRPRSRAGSSGASARAAVEAWTPAPEGHIPPSADCTTTAGHDVMNRKHDPACVASGTSPAGGENVWKTRWNADILNMVWS